jgi:hypothetical protein
MRRADGLVQRRTGAVQASGAASAARSEEEGDSDAAAADSGCTNDSKDTRLTLMEEVLLLGLKDKEVRLLFEWDDV